MVHGTLRLQMNISFVEPELNQTYNSTGSMIFMIIRMITTLVIIIPVVKHCVKENVRKDDTVCS